MFRALGMIASVVTVAVTTRHLGPLSYGHLTTAVMFVGLWTSLTELGVGAVIVRRVTSGTGDLARLVRVNSGLSVMYCIPLAMLAASTGFLTYRGDSEVVAMVLIVCCSLALTTLASCFEPVFLAEVRFTAVAVSDLLSRLVSLGGTIVLVAMHAHLMWFAVVQIIPPAVQLIVQGIAASRIIDCRPVFSLSESWDILRESLPQTGVLIIAVLYWRADGVILSLFSTADQVGVYGLAYTLAFTTSVVSTFFLSSTLSTMTRLFADSKDDFATFVVRSVETMLLVGVPVAVVGAMLSHSLVELMGSSEFVEDGGPSLALLFVAVGLTFLTAAISQALFAAHDQVFLLRLNIINLIVNIALNIALAPHFGAIGAGAALLFTEATGLIVVTWRLSRRSPYATPWLYLLRLGVPVAASVGVVLLASELPVLVTGALAAGAYFAVNLVVGPATLKSIKSMLAGGGDSPAAVAADETNPGRIQP